MNQITLGDIFEILRPHYGSGDSHDAIVATFVTIIIVVALGTLVAVGWAYWRSAGVLGKLKEIAATLHVASLPADRRAARELAADSGRAGEIWHEFDETLVTRGDKVMNTEPAEDYFHGEAIAPVLTSNRLLATMPSVLTALGLLGTFIGLAVGLSGLNLSETTDIDQLRQGIESMVAGAALGFTASVWGVAFSVTVNVIEKIAAGRTLAHIARFQAQIDELFDHHSPEQALLEIERNTRSSSEALEELHEKIGSKLQEAVAGMSDSMQSALTRAIETSMTPTMNALADRATNQSAEIFESLVAQFADGFKSMGATQAEEMSRASAALQTTLAGITDQVGSAIDQMQGAASAQADAHAERAESLSTQLSEVSALTGRLVTALEGSLVALSQRLESAASGVESASGSLRTSSATLSSTASSFTEAGDGLAVVLATTQQTHEAIVTAQNTAASSMGNYVAQLDRLGGMSQEAASSITGASREAATAFEALRASQRQYLDELGSRVTQLNTQLRDWLTEYSDRVAQQTGDRMSEWDNHTRAFSSHMLATSAALSDVVEEISQTMDQARA